MCAMRCGVRCAAQRCAARIGLSKKFKTLGAIEGRESQTYILLMVCTFIDGREEQRRCFQWLTR